MVVNCILDSEALFQPEFLILYRNNPGVTRWITRKAEIFMRKEPKQIDCKMIDKLISFKVD